MDEQYEVDYEYEVEFPAVVRVPLMAANSDEALARAVYFLPVEYEGGEYSIYDDRGFFCRLHMPSFALGAKVFRVKRDGTKEEVQLGQ